MAGDPVIQHLSAHTHLPEVGAAVHVNSPVHDGDTPLHDHEFFELALVVEGRAVHRTVHGHRRAGPGDLFIIHPGQWHAYERCRALRLYNCCIGVGLLGRELAWAASDPSIGPLLPAAARGNPGQGVLALHLDAAGVRSFVADIERIRELLATADAVRATAEIVARILLVLAQSGRALVEQPTATQPRSLVIHPGMERAVQAMDARIDHPWGLKELTRMTGLSRFHLVRLFRRHLGLPPMSWLNRRRVEHAAVMLLTTDLAMAEIGRRVGWNDASYFSRRFRAAFGLGPREYRAQLPMPALKPAADWVQW